MGWAMSRSHSFRVWIGLVAAFSALFASLTTGAPASARPLAEPYDFFSGIPAELSHPGGSLPGTNNFSCRPGVAHPRPIILVHGTGGSRQTNWGTYAPVLANRGYCVFALTYGALPGAWPLSAIGGMGRIESSAMQLARFVDQVRAATGARTVDIVGHSQGTFMAAYYLKGLGGAAKVTNYVSLAPLWRGSNAVGTDGLPPVYRQLLNDGELPVCAACGQQAPDSPIGKVVWRGGSPYVDEVQYTNISTRYDQLVVPYTSGQVAGRRGQHVTNIVVQDRCAADHSDHLAIAGSRRAAYLVLNALDPQHRVRVPCESVSPAAG